MKRRGTTLTDEQRLNQMKRKILILKECIRKIEAASKELNKTIKGGKK